MLKFDFHNLKNKYLKKYNLNLSYIILFIIKILYNI